MKKKNGFIVIPVLILVIIGIAILGGLGYFIAHKNSVTTNTTNSDISNPVSVSGTAVTNADNSKNITIQTQIKTTKKPSQNTIDVCSNIEGIQTSVPAGMSLNGTVCTTAPLAQVMQAPTVAPVVHSTPVNGTVCMDVNTGGPGTFQNGQCVISSIPPQQVVTPPQAPVYAMNTYTNSTYGLSFKYPENMICEQSISSGVYINGSIVISCGHENLSGGLSDNSAGQLSLYVDNGSSEARTEMQNIATESYTAQVGANKFYDFSHGAKSFLLIFKPNYVLEVIGATDLIPPSHIDLTSLTLQ